MILLKDWHDYFEEMPQRTGLIKGVIIVATEEELAEKTKDIARSQYPLLVVTEPVMKPASKDEDNQAELHSGIAFVLMKNDRKQMNDADVLQGKIDTQLGIISLWELMEQDYHVPFKEYDFMRGLQFKSRSIGPEYNLVQHFGWSLLFEIEY